MKPLLSTSALAALLFFAVLPAGGQAGDPSDPEVDFPSHWLVPRLDPAREDNGGERERAWERIPSLPMTMFSPTFGAEPTERTEVRVAHDGEFLYVRGRMYDSDPAGIRVNTLYRDQYSGDDVFAVVLDSFNDHETAVWFTTNPAGTRGDRTVSNDGVFAGSMPMNSDWNAHWDVETEITDEGWFAEFRIPFSTLGFQVVNGEVTMGLIVYRLVARKNERQIFPAIDPGWGGLAFAKPSQAHRIVLRGVEQATPVYLTPYVLGGTTRLPRLVEPPVGGPRWSVESDPTTEVGVDLRFSPVPNLSLDFTVNTDFAQVEADDQQVNLTRFPLFFPEKRQFFQERASTFQFPTGDGPDRLFHSRRIGLEGGEIVRIYGGARAVGRLGGTDFGLLSMQTAAPDGSTSRNTSVLRVSQQVLNPYSSVGGMVTSRLGTGGEDNLAYGVDAVVRPFGDEWVTARWAQSFDEALDERSAFESGLLQARWERIRDDGLSYAGQFRRVGADYRPGLGFQARHDVHFVGGHLQYKTFRPSDSPFRALSARVNTGHFLRNDDGSAESRSVSPVLSAEFRRGVEFRLTGTSSFESVTTPFAIRDVEIPVGDYRFHDVEAQLQLPRSDNFRGDYTATAGSFFDGTRLGVALNPAWNPSRHLELGAAYEVNRLQFADRDASTTTQLARLQVQVALNTQISFSTFAQYSNVADLTTVNARFRYHFREGTDLWVVFDEGMNVGRDALEQPRLPRSAGRALMVKYTRTFIW